MHAASLPHAAPASMLRQAEALVGLPYLPRVQDCMHLVLRAQRQLFGRTVGVPDGAHPVHPHRQQRLIMAGVGTLVRPLELDEAPADGDLVLWLAEGELGTHYHAGTLLLHAGEQWVLHTSEELGASVLQRLAECGMWGLRLEGIYRWL